MKPALFLDRDGVINIDKGYVYKIDDFIFVDGIFELCRHILDMNYDIFIITNQAGIGRGLYLESDYLLLTQWMLGQFRDQKIFIRDVYHCPYHPIYGLGKYKKDFILRKPHHGMIMQAYVKYNIDLPRSILIGDKFSDIQAGHRAGIKRLVFFGSTELIQTHINYENS